MKRTLKFAFAAVLVGALFLSCTTVEIESALPNASVSLTPIPEADYEIVGRFDEDVKVFFTINGLITLSEVDVDAILSREINRYDGDGVVNLKITDEFSGTDILLQIGLGAGGYVVGSLLAGPDPYVSSAAGTAGASVAQFFLQSRTVTLSGDVYSLE
jgi:hypothetical protein